MNKYIALCLLVKLKIAKFALAKVFSRSTSVAHVSIIFDCSGYAQDPFIYDVVSLNVYVSTVKGILSASTSFYYYSYYTSIVNRFNHNQWGSVTGNYFQASFSII